VSDLRVFVSADQRHMPEIKARAAEIGASVNRSAYVEPGQMHVFDLEQIEQEVAIWMSCIKE
jgi:hypothetical protein